MILASSAESIRIRRNRKTRRQNSDVNSSNHIATNITLLQESELKIENVTENYVKEKNPTKFSLQKEIENPTDTFKLSRKEKNITREVPIQDARRSYERIINVEVERHSQLKRFELECKFGNVSD